MDLSSLRLFVRIARLGAIGRAASDLGLSAASASARLAKLEKDLGARLFHRTTRAVSLTTDGTALLPYAETVLETWDQGVGSIGGRSTEPTGTLRMTMPGSFGRMHILPALGAFVERHPQVKLDLALSDEVLDVVEGAYDLIVRNTELDDSTMTVRKLADDRRLLVAAPDYLARHGEPATPDDLAQHATVILGNAHRWEFEDGTVVQPRRSHRLNDGEAVRLAIEAGLGIGVKSLWNAYRSLHDGTLVEVLPDRPLRTRTAIWALCPPGRLTPPKVRAMIDCLLGLFSPVPPWERFPRPGDVG